MAKVVDLASRRGCEHKWEDGEIGAGIAVRVCTKCGLGHTVGDDADDVMAKAVARCAVLQQENDRLREALHVIATCPPEAVHLMPLAAQAALANKGDAP